MAADVAAEENSRRFCELMKKLPAKAAFFEIENENGGAYNGGDAGLPTEPASVILIQLVLRNQIKPTHIPAIYYELCELAEKYEKLMNQEKTMDAI